jgi:hypothetical protein
MSKRTIRTRKKGGRRSPRSAKLDESGGTAKSTHKTGEDTLKQHIGRIREIEADLNKSDVEKRYQIGVEVAAIHTEDPDRGVKQAAKVLKRWNFKTLYEYAQVRESWDATSFKKIRSDVGPEGNVLSWSDFVGLSYIKNPTERERVRRQALERNLSVKMLRREAPKPKADAEESSSPTSALSSALCKVINDAPLLRDLLTTILALLERRGALELSPVLVQHIAASTDTLVELSRPFVEVVPRLRALVGAAKVEESNSNVTAVPADRNDDVELMPQSGTVAHKPEQAAALDGAESDPEVEVVAAE